MRVYWFFLLLSLLIYVWSNNSYCIVEVDGRLEKRGLTSQGILFFGVILFFCGLRSGIADTGAYIHIFNEYPSNVSSINWISVDKDKGFYLLSVLYKQFVSDDYHGWLFLIAFISCYAMMKGFLKHSSDFGMSCFLFIATTSFVYLINGMRQFICISILLACSDWISDKRYAKFCILCFLLSFIHGSALILIPLCFILNTKPWGITMWMGVLAALVIGLNYDAVLPIIGDVIEDTQYSNYNELIQNGEGSNILRLCLTAVPVGIAFYYRSFIESLNDRYINLLVNLSTINFSLYLIGTFANGMATARLAAFFDIFNLILLPWEMNNLFEGQNSKIIKMGCIMLYIAFFYVQMVLTWNLPYESDVLGLYIYH